MEEILPVSKAVAVGLPLSERGCYLSAAERVVFTSAVSNLVSDNEMKDETKFNFSFSLVSLSHSPTLLSPFLHRAAIV